MKRIDLNQIPAFAIGTLVACLFAATTSAQSITSAGLDGLVTTEQGDAIEGASVDVVHSPTGATRNVATRANGSYSLRGMRVGGPYTVTVSANGYRSARQEGIFLTVNNVTSVNLSLRPEEIEELEEFVLEEAPIDPIFNPSNTSTVTRLDEDRITSVSTNNRYLLEYAKLNPKMVVDKDFNQIYGAGINARFNDITVDGVQVNDPFGLNSNGMVSRFSSPVSVDAMESMEVETTPFDIRQSKFTGASINVVTKSGTNEFKGSAYYHWRDSTHFGDNMNGVGFDPAFEEDTWGITIGGPILRNKLFFFVNFEEIDRQRSGSAVGLIGSGASTIFQAAPEQVQRIADISNNVWNFDPGTIAGADTLTDRVEKILVKADWNIGDKHHLVFKWDRNHDNNFIIAQRSATSFSLSSYWFDQPSKIENYVAQLYSDWSDRFSTEVRVSYADYDGTPIPSSDFPEVSITVNDFGDRVFLGTERFRQYNIIFSRTVTFSGIATLFSGPNEIVFGLDYFDKDVRNTFLFDNRGTYVFASIDDWEAGTPASLSHRFESSGTNVTAIWTERVWSPFVQNTWHAGRNFAMTFGLRWDINDFPEAPPFNERFQDFFGFPNNDTIDGTTIFSPRFSFNWDLRGDSTWQMRGGFGKFYGKAAGVWLSNPFTNNGLVTVTAGFPDGPPPFEPDPGNQPTGVPGSPSGEVDSLQDGLELPSSWKVVLATDFRFKAPLLGDMVASIDGEWSFVDKALTLYNIGVEPVGAGPDGRTIFSDSRIAAAGFGGFGMVTQLRNTNLGKSAYYTLSLERPRKEDGWYTGFSYTYGSSEDVNSLTGFIAVENFRATPAFNANTDELGTSPFEIRHRFIWSVSKDINWGGRESLWKTNLTLFYEGRSGKPYSYVFNHPFGGNLNGDDAFFIQSINDLFYTPQGPDDPYVTWDGNLDGTLDESEIAQRDAFFFLVDAHPDLERGRQHSKNDARLPWINQWDLKISQDIPILRNWGKFQFTLDILNIGNMLDSSSGIIRDFPIGFGGTPSQRVATAFYDPDSNKYVYSAVLDESGKMLLPNSATVEDRYGQSRWSILFGIKYVF